VRVVLTGVLGAVTAADGTVDGVGAPLLLLDPGLESESDPVAGMAIAAEDVFSVEGPDVAAAEVSVDTGVADLPVNLSVLDP